MKRLALFLAVWLCACLPLPSPAQEHLPLRLGVDQAGGNAFRGAIAAVRLYDRVLAASDLAALAAAPMDAAPTLPGLVGQWLRPALPTTADLASTLADGLTIEAWIRPEAGLGGRIADRITPGGSDGFLLDIHPGDTLRCIVGHATLSHPLPHRERWTHVAATADATGTIVLFVDGVRVAPSGASSPDGVAITPADGSPGRNLTLWYQHPAARWTEAAVIGNGRLGGMVWGGVARERIDLNEDTLWSGEPYDNLNPKGLASLPEIRRLLLAGQDREAQRLVERDMNGRYNQSYQPLGDLTLSFPISGEVTEYRRELDLEQALARVQFVHQGVRYTREVFASHPAQALVVRLIGDPPGNVSFTATLGCQLHHRLAADRGCLRLAGRCPAHADPHYLRSKNIVWDDAPDGKGMRFETRLLPVHQGGRIAIDDTGITAAGCDSVTLLLVAATSYNGPWKSPSREGRDPAQLCAATLAALAGLGYGELRAAQVADHQRLFGRVTLNLGASAAQALPTDARVRSYAPGRDTALAALYYQFGRYLLIASSRPGSQPAHLQGLWSHELQPPWSANWTLNCNAEINYWPVETANLAECHLPLIDLAEQLSVDGAHIAQGLYGVRGWTAHHNTDIWRQAGPVSGSALWSIFQVGGAWLCQHLWEHYAFSGDLDDLRRVWPTIKGAARFHLDSLMEEPSHRWLVTGPDTNFENRFQRSDGTTGCVCLGPTGSMQMVRELLQHCVTASRILGTDAGLRAEAEQALARLPPMTVSPTTGELQEWLADWRRTADCQVLSSWGAICGTQITPRGTPQLAAGLRTIFDKAQWWKKGLVGSWQGAFQANAYARLGDGDTAREVLDTHLARSVNANLSARFPACGVEWQIDGNLGLTAAIGEMLLQSHTQELELLPALPQAWSAGAATGLRGRGGFIVDLAWKDGRLAQATVRSGGGGACRVRYRDATLELALPPGGSASVADRLR